MKWKGRRQSRNIEDRRGRRRMPRGTKRAGLGSIAVAFIAAYFLGVDPSTIMSLLGGGSGGSAEYTTDQNYQPSSAENELASFTSVVLADTEGVWQKIFAERGNRYQEPKLVMFSGEVTSACGAAQSAMGPFYCPADKKVYIDLSFYRDLKSRHQAPGDFAQAYVIAHEVGHHVQNLMGVSTKVHQQRQRVSKAEGNQLSVRQELQADCFAGVWAYFANQANVIEPGDIGEALNAAAQIGDDRLQEQSRGYVTPESFTHGSSAQRVEWFKRGYQSGDITQCDTFG